MSLNTSYQALSEFLQRQLSRWSDQPLLLVAAPAGLSLTGLAPAQTSFWAGDWRVHQAALQAGFTSYFATTPLPRLSAIPLIFWPKAHAEGFWWISQLCQQQMTDFYLLGEHQAGIRTAAQKLQTAGFEVNKLDNARRCSSYRVTLVAAQPDLPQDRITPSQWTGPDGLQVCSLPGVFSQGQLDEGSALLIDALRKHGDQLPQQGRILDLGCGCGLLGAWLLKQHPRMQLLATDVSAQALMATQATLAANQLQGTTLPTDIFTGLPQEYRQDIDLLMTNPPFHTGIHTDYQLSQRLIQQARDYLRPGGQLWLVANRFLPYPELLNQHFGGFTRRAENGKFCVYYTDHKP